jgi:hypothetical protein
MVHSIAGLVRPSGRASASARQRARLPRLQTGISRLTHTISASDRLQKPLKQGA